MSVDSAQVQHPKFQEAKTCSIVEIPESTVTHTPWDTSGGWPGQVANTLESDVSASSVHKVTLLGNGEINTFSTVDIDTISLTCQSKITVPEQSAVQSGSSHYSVKPINGHQTGGLNSRNTPVSTMHSSTGTKPAHIGEWRCPKCAVCNFSRRVTCFRCGLGRPTPLPTNYSSQDAKKDAARVSRQHSEVAPQWPDRRSTDRNRQYTPNTSCFDHESTRDSGPAHVSGRDQFQQRDPASPWESPSPPQAPRSTPHQPQPNQCNRPGFQRSPIPQQVCSGSDWFIDPFNVCNSYWKTLNAQVIQEVLLYTSKTRQRWLCQNCLSAPLENSKTCFYCHIPCSNLSFQLFCELSAKFDWLKSMPPIQMPSQRQSSPVIQASQPYFQDQQHNVNYWITHGHGGSQNQQQTQQLWPTLSNSAWDISNSWASQPVQTQYSHSQSVPAVMPPQIAIQNPNESTSLYESSQPTYAVDSNWSHQLLISPNSLADRMICEAMGSLQQVPMLYE